MARVNKIKRSTPLRDGDWVKDFEVEVEVTVRVRRKSKSRVYSATRGEHVGSPSGKSETAVLVFEEQQITPEGRAILVEDVARSVIQHARKLGMST